jgi:hypothetical protein
VPINSVRTSQRTRWVCIPAQPGECYVVIQTKAGGWGARKGTRSGKSRMRVRSTGGKWNGPSHGAYLPFTRIGLLTPPPPLPHVGLMCTCPRSCLPIRSRARNWSALHMVQTGSRVRPASYSLNSGWSFLWIKLPRLEADHSPPSTVKVKNGVAVPPLTNNILTN